MGLDGIQKQSAVSRPYDVGHQKERDAILNDLYRVERPKRACIGGNRMGLGVVVVLLTVNLAFVIHRGGSESKKNEIPGADTIQTEVPEGTSNPTGYLTNPDAWYAVHLVDGKVYYGKLLGSGSGTQLTLVNVFYTASKDELEGTPTSTMLLNKLVLVKLGTEAHRPEDKIVISPDALVFFEKLKADSPVVKTIEAYLQDGR